MHIVYLIRLFTFFFKHLSLSFFISFQNLTNKLFVPIDLDSEQTEFTAAVIELICCHVLWIPGELAPCAREKKTKRLQ